jgi:hypothetical protein
MTDEAINKKLAEWAGFRYDEDGEFVNGMWANLSGWSRPGEKVRFPEVPEFTDSLDLCFQYLVPKLVDYYLDMLSLDGTIQHHAAVLSTWASVLHTASATSPALALCKAIEQLIEAEHD